MINLGQIEQKLDLKRLAGTDSAERIVAGGYASDLLSCAMSRARQDYVWVTLQAHMNVLAVAGLLGLAGVIITEGQEPAAEVIERAEREKVVLLVTPKTTFTVVSELAALGVQGELDGE